jgi:hypothetical protein
MCSPVACDVGIHYIQHNLLSFREHLLSGRNLTIAKYRTDTQPPVKFIWSDRSTFSWMLSYCFVFSTEDTSPAILAASAAAANARSDANFASFAFSIAANSE